MAPGYPGIGHVKGTAAPVRRMREQHGRLGMCFFVSGERVLPSLPWMQTSRRLASKGRLLLQLSQVVERVGRIEAPQPLAAAFMWVYRLPDGSISGLLRKCATANSFTRASFPGVTRGTRVVQFDKKNQERTTLLSTTSDRQKARVKRKNVCKSNVWRDDASLKAHNCVTSISARKTGTWAFFSKAVFNHFPLEDFLKPTGID